MTWPGALFLAAILGVAGAIWWIRSSRIVPRGWRHVGTPPAGADAALEALRPLCPGMGWGGTIRWRTAPWLAGYDDPQELVGGQVLTMATHEIACLDLPALVHEVGHLYLQGSDEGPAFLAWVSSAGEAVRRAVAGVGGMG